jgi:hypothetical protein
MELSFFKQTGRDPCTERIGADFFVTKNQPSAGGGEPTLDQYMHCGFVSLGYESPTHYHFVLMSVSPNIATAQANANAGMAEHGGSVQWGVPNNNLFLAPPWFSYLHTWNSGGEYYYYYHIYPDKPTCGDGQPTYQEP